MGKLLSWFFFFPLQFYWPKERWFLSVLSPQLGKLCFFFFSILVKSDRNFIILKYSMSVWEKAMAPHSGTLAWKLP